MIRTAQTENGMVEGIEASDPRITAFKGIPFAAPPIGKNRWRAPQPCEKWEGIRKAYKFAPISVQDRPAMGTDIYCKEWHVDKDIAISEDCLYLNIWTNAKKTDENLPVVVWFFGGMLQWGYTAEMEFDGERLARRDIIVVTVNYRLNVFGFLAHPELTKQQSDFPSSFGNLDQQAGLRWVVRNISAFGGNPHNITIAGQSAGGGSVLHHLTYPGNFGLFQKAIIESGIICNPFTLEGFSIPQNLKNAEQAGVDFFSFLGVKTIEEARKLDAFYILDKYSEYVQNHPRMLAVCDGTFCRGNPFELIRDGKWAQVPIFSGNTADEFPEIIDYTTKNELKAKAAQYFGKDNAEQFVRLADNSAHHTEVSIIETMVKTLFLIIEKSRKERSEEALPCYYYRFDADIPGEDNPGSFHSVELWFFFETLAKCWRPFTGKHYDLARKMCNYWCNFVKNGNPNGIDIDGASMPEWEPFTGKNPFGLVFGKTNIMIEQQNKPLEDFIIQHNTQKICKEKK